MDSTLRASPDDCFHVGEENGDVGDEGDEGDECGVSNMSETRYTGETIHVRVNIWYVQYSASS